MLLPYRPRRAYLMGFTLALALLGGALLAGALALALSPVWALAALPAALAWAALGMRVPGVSYFLYRVWNRLGGDVDRVTASVLSAICFYVVLTVTRLAGAGLRLSPKPGEPSGWVAHQPQDPAGYIHEFVSEVRRTRSRSWLGGYLSWAWSSGNLWAVCLVPFLAWLRLTRRPTTAIVPADVYTLY